MSANPDGTATTTYKTFSRITGIGATINADAATVWRLLATAATYPEWNSTIVSLDGEISPGSKIRPVSKLDPSRTFTLKIKEFKPSARLAGGEALGTRLYSLAETSGGQTRFEMVDRRPGVPALRKQAPVIRYQLFPIHRKPEIRSRTSPLIAGVWTHHPHACPVLSRNLAISPVVGRA